MIGRLFILSAPSGAGKSSLTEAIIKRIQLYHPNYPIERVITYTTKAPRINERNGYEYHFIEKHDFEYRLEQGFFIEYSHAYGTYYGSPVSIATDLKKGKSFILILDRVGAQKIIGVIKEAILVWIMPPSLDQLKKRLIGRGTEAEEQIERRMARGLIEIELEKNEPLYHHYIVNDSFNDAVEQLISIFLWHMQKNEQSGQKEL
jgi:guanylate kinase